MVPRAVEVEDAIHAEVGQLVEVGLAGLVGELLQDALARDPAVGAAYGSPPLRRTYTLASGSRGVDRGAAASTASVVVLQGASNHEASKACRPVYLAGSQPSGSAPCRWAAALAPSTVAWADCRRPQRYRKLDDQFQGIPAEGVGWAVAEATAKRSGGGLLTLVVEVATGGQVSGSTSGCVNRTGLPSDRAGSAGVPSKHSQQDPKVFSGTGAEHLFRGCRIPVMTLFDPHSLFGGGTDRLAEIPHPSVAVTHTPLMRS